jgi:3-deoxy-D-manno-octulosonic-acid transferase
MAHLGYTVLAVLLLPWALLHLVSRSRRQPEYLKHWGERFGFYPARPTQPVIWIHAVSVGETRAAQPLLAALRHHFPEHRIVFSHMTPTGRETSAALFGDTVDRIYLPYDTPWAVARFLAHFQPTLGLIMETELWPNLVTACRLCDIPLLLVNARLSERSARRYARVPALSRHVLRELAGIAAQGEDDARRLRELGAPEVAVLGNMKFDITPPPEQLELGTELRVATGGRSMFLCASTREGEEALILDAWPRDTSVLLAIVPRHPQRFGEVAALIAAKGFALQRRSAGGRPDAATQVWLGDSMGELFAWYAAADVAFVGGSLLNYGSQNLIEPCSVGTPVLIGPSTFNFAEAAREALAAQAARQVGNATELVSTALTLIADPKSRTTMADFGRAFAERHRGATARTMALIEQIIPTKR